MPNGVLTSTQVRERGGRKREGEGLEWLREGAGGGDEECASGLSDEEGATGRGASESGLGSAAVAGARGGGGQVL